MSLECVSSAALFRETKNHPVGTRPSYEVATLTIVLAFAPTKTIYLASDQVILSYLKERNNKNYVVHHL